jgi:hypothetical protein
MLAQAADQVGILREALDQDRPRAVESRSDVGHLLVDVDEAFRDFLRIILRLGEQQFRQRLEAGFLGNLRLGAALRLERQIDILQTPLVVG